jgi:hypothetical protein
MLLDGISEWIQHLAAQCELWCLLAVLVVVVVAFVGAGIAALQILETMERYDAL